MRIHAQGLAVTVAAVLGCVATDVPTDEEGALLERGRYLARMAGCNDCHTTGYWPYVQFPPPPQ